MYCTIAKNPWIPLFSSVSRGARCSRPPFSRSKLRSFSTDSSHIAPKYVREVEAWSFSTGFCRVRRPSCFPAGIRQSRYFPCHRKLNSLIGNGTHQNFTYGFHLKGLGTSCGMRTRGYSVASYQKTRENGNGGNAGKRLPWLKTAYNGKKMKPSDEKAASKMSGSAWQESADKYFEKKGSNVMVEDKESRVGAAESLKSENGSSVKRYEIERKAEEEEDVDPIDDPRWDRIKTRYNRFGERETRYEKPEVVLWNKQDNWGRKTWREATESSVPKMVGESVYGVGPILAALTVGRRDFYALYVQEGLDLNGNNKKKKRKDKKGVENILKIAEKIGLTVKEISKHDLNMVVDNRPHQGLVLDASPLEMVSVKGLDPVLVSEGDKAPLWVALDEVTDPQNLGAILRSSYFFGVKGVVVCAKNSAPLSGVVSKASAGALELIELRSCKNMMQFLSSSVENGWRVLGGSVSSKAVPLNEVQSGIPTILVLGSEGSGLRPLVERSCTQVIKITGNMPMDLHTEEYEEVEVEEFDRSSSGQEINSFLAVESLNVSVATGVLLYHLVGNSNHAVVEKQIDES